MAIDIVKYDGPSDVYAWKYPEQDMNTWTQLIVNESQEAILFKSGQALDLFGPGRHTLSTNNIPLLNHIVNLPFGGKTPFTAEVWYINRLHTLDIKWGTTTPIQLQDPKYNLFVPVRAFGQFGIQVIDARKFIVKLVGTVSVFDRETLSRYFKGVLLTKIKDQIASYLVHKKISILDISAYLDDISIHLNESLNPAFETYGIRLVNFFVTSINIPEDDPGVRKLKDALAKRAEMDIFGYSYQQERTFDTLQSAAANEGAASGGLMGAGIGLSMGLGVGGVVGSMFGEQVQNLSTNPNMNPNKISEKIKCNSCGTECDANMVFCYSCGSKLLKPSSEVKKSCSTCHADILGTMKFCPHCGAKQLKICDSCGFELHGEMKFCPNCGKSCN